MSSKFVVSVGFVALGAGVFGGIWMDWRTRVPAPPPTTGRTINYVVQPYEKANLVVAPKDTITWTRADGQNQNLQINFASDDTPCVSWTANSLSCQIDPTKPVGAYLYQCTDRSGGTYDCPDPGIQQRTTGGNGTPTPVLHWQPVGYFTQVGIDFKDLATWTVPGETPSAPIRPSVTAPPGPSSQEGPPKTEPKPKKAIAPSTVLAAVACNKSTGNPQVTQETPPPATEDKPISVQQGHTIFWDGPYDTQITFTGSNPCNGGVMAVSTHGPWSCQIPSNQAKTSYPYTANVKCANSKSTPESISVVAGP